MSDFIPSQRSKRLEEFAASVALDFRRLEEKIDQQYVLTDDFAFIFQECFRAVADNPHKEKLEVFRGILVNSTLSHNLKEEEKEFFLTLASNLSTLHLRILRFMAMPEDYLEAAGISQGAINGGFSQFFPVALPGVSLDVIKIAFADLYQYGLITTDKSIFGTMTAGKSLEMLRGRVSPAGLAFMKFCTIS